jgi:Ca2+/Na+ antiporter
VSKGSLDKQGKILAFAAVMEVTTGLALAIDPSLVVTWLVGMEVSGVGTAVGRCFGITLLALGLACWPDPKRAGGDATSRGMLAYNALIAFYLTFLGTVRHVGGRLLWPAIVLHAVVALLLVLTWRGKRSTRAADK